MIKYFFVIFYLRVVIVFEGRDQAAGNYTAVAGMSDQPN